MTPHKESGHSIRRDVFSTCPVCESELQVSRLHCQTCGTTIDGQFSVGRFGRLSREQTGLLESFLRSRGNLRELERELGVSYPTVRSRIEALLRALGLSDGEMPASPDPEPAARPAVAVDASTRREVLERLARHELTAEEASAALRGTSDQVTQTAPDMEETK